jgi:hypothetical protein
MMRGPPKWMMAVALLLPALFARAQTNDPLPAETRLVGLGTAPAATEEPFTIATAEDLTVTLTDLKTPAALASATVVVTQGGAIVQIATGNAAATLAPPAASATVTIPGAVGQYTLRVFGAPNASFSVGTFSVCVAPTSNPSNCIQNASLVGNISAQSTAADPTVSTLSVNLTVTTAGTYTVTFADDVFPTKLNVAPNLALFQGSLPLPNGLGIQSGATFNLNPGTYTLLAIAQADPTVKAGLYGITISGPTGVAPLINGTFPVGTLTPAPQTSNPSAQMLALKVTDFMFPAALASARAMATSGNTVLGTASSSGGPTSFAAPTGPLQVWSFGTPGTDAGTYEIDLNSSSANLLTAAFGIAHGNSFSFAYVTSALSAGSYQAAAGDFGVPAALQGLTFAVAQNAAILQKSAAAAIGGTVMFSATAGPVVLLVDAQVPATGNGLFGVSVQSPGSASLLFDRAQGVTTSGLFDTQVLNLGTSGDFDVTLMDLKFPGQFQDLDLVVSQGSVALGKDFGGAPFSFAATAPGTYQLTFIATPAAQQQYGLYAVAVVYSAPTVTLTASPSTVTAGAATTLSWTTKDATSCMASGGNWIGSPAVGSDSVSLAVPSTTTYTLTCTGPGGMIAKSVTVTVTAAAHSGGGGEIDVSLLIFLTAFGLVREMRRRAPTLREACSSHDCDEHATFRRHTRFP